MDYDFSSPIKMFCANCGTKIVGYKGIDGALRIDCPRCFIKIFSKQKTAREIDIKLKKIN